jgi:serine phosphatase RsbU (regulator of sigma subunit)
MRPVFEVSNGYPFGFLFLIISMSIYLARDFAKTNERILEQERQAKELEMQRRLLEAEDARKSKELEEARQLQLSMLPKCVTEIPGLDICFHMETATEVGGDYYDYSIAKEGTLTIAIGDATGHGMKAGIMVSIIKSLFITEASRSDIPSFFKKCSQSLKQMRLGNLYMAMMLVKIKGHELTASSAGMPPIYIY